MSWFDTDWDERHPACPGGCGQLDDECMCPNPSPFNSRLQVGFGGQALVCPCACNSGGFCGGCGHAGCGGRR